VAQLGTLTGRAARRPCQYRVAYGGARHDLEPLKKRTRHAPSENPEGLGRSWLIEGLNRLGPNLQFDAPGARRESRIRPDYVGDEHYLGG